MLTSKQAALTNAIEATQSPAVRFIMSDHSRSPSVSSLKTNLDLCHPPRGAEVHFPFRKVFQSPLQSAPICVHRSRFSPRFNNTRRIFSTNSFFGSPSQLYPTRTIRGLERASRQTQSDERGDTLTQQQYVKHSEVNAAMFGEPHDRWRVTLFKWLYKIIKCEGRSSNAPASGAPVIFFYGKFYLFACLFGTRCAEKQLCYISHSHGRRKRK